MKRILSFQRTCFYLCVLIAFFLPAYIWAVPVLIALLLINWIAEGKFKEKFHTLLSNKPALLFIAFYLLFLFGMIWTKNKEEGWFDLQVKLSLLLFPLIFGSSKKIFDKRKMQQILFAFVAGCLIDALICFAHAFYLWVTQHEDNFTYTKLSVFLHPSYLAMYICFSIAIIFHYELSITYRPPSLHSVLTSILIGFFCITIIMFQSKAGMIIGAFLIIFYSIRHILIKKQFLLPLLLLSFIFAMYGLINREIVAHNDSRVNVALYNLTNKQADSTSKESSLVRLAIWKTIPEIAAENNYLGVGTGDVNDALIKKYTEKGMGFAIEHKLNAHNQYLQTLVATGLPGMLLLFLCFIVPSFQSFKKKNILLLLFCGIAAFNFLVESMLEVQAGVIFYAFFNSLLLFSEAETI